MALPGAKDVDRYKCHEFFAFQRSRQDEVGAVKCSLRIFAHHSWSASSQLCLIVQAFQVACKVCK